MSSSTGVVGGGALATGVEANARTVWARGAERNTLVASENILEL